MKMTVGEFFESAVELDMRLVAHRIYWALSAGKIHADEDVGMLKALQSDKAAITAMHDANILGIGRIKLFAVKTNTPDWFAFYFAEHSLDVFRLHREKFREHDVKIVNVDRLMWEVMASAETGKEEFLFERKGRVVEFPAYVGHARAGEMVLFQV